MANQEHLEILKQGTDVWNEWRMKHPGVRPNLSNADLSYADLSSADLSSADLSSANLRGADLGSTILIDATLRDTTLRDASLIDATLEGANLSGANFIDATLKGANLRSADLSSANFISASLEGTNLSGANLSNANLSNTTLTDTNLSGADLSNVYLWNTIFGEIDLRLVKGLEKVEHGGPSTIGINTLIRSQGDIPAAFLRGTGATEEIIEYAKSLTRRAIEYYTCFISYSSLDEDLAERLYNDLQGKGVRCWFAPHSMRPGDFIRRTIDESIRLYDKLMLLLSQHSVESDWVGFEVEAAMEKERKRNLKVLYPIRIDDTVFTTDQVWTKDIRRRRHIGDFTNWKDHDTYQQHPDQFLGGR